MKALEELTQDIREKLPRLKELTIGTIIKSKMEDRRNFITVDAYYEIGYSEEYGLCSADDNHVNIDGYTYNANSFEIIGKNPMLNDVMEWFKYSDMRDGINMMYEWIWVDTVKEVLRLWNLSKPYLKDQSPELITFLHRLIKA